MPEGFRNLSRFARSGFGGRNEAPPSIIVLAAVWRDYRPSPIIRPDLRDQGQLRLE